ncbi:hypothetical protein CEUSTIGMA_g11724.t1 [Chlamydomonas eustigma]|uniref:Impact N-terminal domain-containing protein n=1 Tax=Chlamydomonas eustigma TaxID=1157962 RepID=A0A250XN15_9CHLO|nr:hypothetical protein CEUSTIGMA_g11724.t1 [Chlamydomonas eustigma]|eukprot:GAX84302.1 hypothetical protein CEUSTIGMA_g11724.t1 [Chlamydomonas eustigma]
MLKASNLTSAWHSLYRSKTSTSAATTVLCRCLPATIACTTSMEVEVKKSKFVVKAWHVSSPQEALETLREASDKKASHNCWAYQIGSEFRSSDDGEPAGTAGRPILAAIHGENIDQACVLITRYFGGIQLGPGGLIRAYGGAARNCLRGAPKKALQSMQLFEFRIPWGTHGGVYHVLDTVGAKIQGPESYTEDGYTMITATVDSLKSDQLELLVTEVSAGRVQTKRISKPVFNPLDMEVLHDLSTHA